MREVKRKGKSERSRTSVRDNGGGGGEGENAFPSQDEILETFTAVCDYMDWERSHQDKVPLSDYIIKSKHATIKYTGPVDSKGRPKVPFKEIPKPLVMNHHSSSHTEQDESGVGVGVGGSSNQGSNNQAGEGVGSGGAEGEAGEVQQGITHNTLLHTTTYQSLQTSHIKISTLS